MARLNRTTSYDKKTCEGAPADPMSDYQALKRKVATCLLWEGNFYEDGVDNAEKIVSLVGKVQPEKVVELADYARNEQYLRHVPLLLIVAMAKHRYDGSLIESAIDRVIRRPDGMCELLAIYEAANDGELKPIANAIKRGLRRKIVDFPEWQLSKYNRKRKIRLKDIVCLVHPKPQSDRQEKVIKKLLDDELETPDTWETNLSDGADKKETFERLIKQGKLGGMATIMNLRNMVEAGVDRDLIHQRLDDGLGYVLPFRYLTAARMVPELEPALDKAMVQSLKNMDKIQGDTCIVVDVSGSMDHALASRSMTTRLDAACGVAIMARHLCEGNVRVFTFSRESKEVPARSGMALRDAICNSQYHGGTYLGSSLKEINSKDDSERMIVITDEQSHDRVDYPESYKRGYAINVSTMNNGVTYDGHWTRIDGWSESVFDFIQEIENIDRGM